MAKKLLKMTRSFLLLLLLLPMMANGQPVMSLKNCIEYGLSHHRSTVVYANESLAAQAKAREVRAAYLPAVNLTGSIDDNLKVQETVIPAGLFSPTDTRIAFTKQYSSNITAQLDQTIYDQSLITGLKANAYSKQQALLNEEQNAETIIYNVSTAYYQIFVYRQQLQLLQANLESYRQQLEITQLQLSKGVITEVDVNKIQVNYNNTQSQVLVAESNLALSENQLKNAIGFPVSETLVIDTEVGAMPVERLAPLADPAAFSVFNRTDYKLTDVNISLLSIDQKKIRAGAFPRLSAYARYGGIGYGDNLNGSFSSMTDFSVIGLKLNIPVFDGLKRNAQYHQAKYKLVNALENQRLEKENEQLEFENARTKLVKAQSGLENDQRNVDLAQKVFQATSLQYQKGITDLTDWLNAQGSLKESQSNYLNSLYNFYLAVIDLEKAKGTLKSFYTSL